MYTFLVVIGFLGGAGATIVVLVTMYENYKRRAYKSVGKGTVETFLKSKKRY